PLASLIDHTLLRADATADDIAHLAAEGVQLGVATVCVNGQWVAWAKRQTEGRIGVAAVAGFPLGASGPPAKAAETLMAVRDGASEIDVVQSLGWARAGEWGLLGAELRAVVEAAGGAAVKVIIESAALTPEQIRQSCIVAVATGAAYVKTSTGFHASGGATLEAVRQMRQVVGNHCGVKASGGIRTAEDAIAMLWAGANRIGASAAATWDPAIVRQPIKLLAR
ncbi:MAG TPA: deoxyribose-phosphate aldolase, partial [Gemmatimonadales bacterium]|nr:deoxyribose-phosphate aldolase [Gemmatimonadales bacterium]